MPAMKNYILLFLLVFMTFAVFGQKKKSQKVLPQKTRNYSLTEAVSKDSLRKSPLLVAIQGLKLKAIKMAYKQNRLAVDSILKADSLEPTTWRLYTYQAAQVFVQAKKGPAIAMALYMPPFLLLFLLFVLPLLLKTFFTRPSLADATKPENASNIEDVDEQDDGNSPPASE